MLNNNFGRSMIEMIGVLVIIGALSTGGIVGYTKALHQNKVNKAIEQIGVISAHLSTIGANGGLYDGMSNKSATKLKAILPEMRTNPTSTTDFGLKNPFGGSVTINSAKLLDNAGDDQAYTIEYSGLNKQACLALAGNDWGSAKNSSFIGIAVGPTNSINNVVDKIYLKCSGEESVLNATVVGCNNGTTIGTPISASKAVNVCTECNNDCAIVLKYY